MAADENQTVPGCCPVCERPYAPDPSAGNSGTACVECGWLLLSGYRAGDVDELRHQAFASALASARQRSDTRAMARAFQVPNEHGEMLDEECLLSLVRGGRPPDELIRQELRSAAETRQRLPEDFGTSLEPLSQIIHGGRPVAFLGLTAAGIEIETVEVDAAGYPVLAERTHYAAPWERLVTGLPVGDGEPGETRRFRLAGGVPSCGSSGEPNPAADQVRRRGVAPEVLRRLPHLARHDVVLVRQVVGWGLIEQVAGTILGQYRCQAELGLSDLTPLREAVTQLLEQVPLGYPLGLVTAARDQETGALRAEALPLFDVGARPGDEAVVVLHGPPAGSEALALPVVALGNDGWHPITAGTVAAGPGEPITVRIQLSASRRPELAAPDVVALDLAAPGQRTLPDLIEALPAALDAPQVTDLACAIDLTGEDDRVRDRLGLLRAIIEQARVRSPTPGTLRVAVAGYGDHPFTPRDLAISSYLWFIGFDTAAAVAGRLDGLAAAPDQPLAHGHVTAVEDALDALASASGWLPGSRRALVLIGCRPPCEARNGQPFPRCPNQLDWSECLGRIASGRPLSLAASVEAPATWAQTGYGATAAIARAERIWGQLGASGWAEPAAADLGRLLLSLGLPATSSDRPFPLALAAPVGIAKL